MLLPELVVKREADWQSIEEGECVHVFQLVQPQFSIPTAFLSGNKLTIFWLMAAMVEASQFGFSKETVRRMNLFILFICHLEKRFELHTQDVRQLMLSLAVLLVVTQVDDERLRSGFFQLFMEEFFYPVRLIQMQHTTLLKQWLLSYFCMLSRLF